MACIRLCWQPKESLANEDAVSFRIVDDSARLMVLAESVHVNVLVRGGKDDCIRFQSAYDMRLEFICVVGLHWQSKEHFFQYPLDNDLIK